MSYMFASTNIPTLDLSGFNTGSVTNMSYMFAGAQTPEVDLHTFDVSQVTTIYSLFAGHKLAVRGPVISIDSQDPIIFFPPLMYK